MLQALGILEGYDLRAMKHNSADYFHHVAEALELSFADRKAFIGDPRFVRDMPRERLLSRECADERRKLNRADSVQGVAPPGRATSTIAYSARRGSAPLQFFLNFVAFAMNVGQALWQPRLVT
jgi:gamma-glutamyltranspeptidase/glutathione hydrolase